MLQPIVLNSNLGGWEFLKRTHDRQLEAFSQNPVLTRETEYFIENIGSVNTAEDLVNDRTLLKVALGAFGLQDDLNNKYFIRKILEEGTTVSDSLANKFTDKRYQEFSRAFGLGPNEIPGNLVTRFSEEISNAYIEQTFETAVGEQSEAMQIALYAKRKLPELAAEDGSENQKWFGVLGQAPLRNLLSGALALPEAFAQVDIDKQLEVFQSRSSSLLSVKAFDDFNNASVIENTIRRYVVQNSIAENNLGSSPASIALQLITS